MMNWIDIDERLPPQDVYVLIVVHEDHKSFPWTSVQTAGRYGSQWMDGKNGEEIKFKRSRVTHWMVIPDAPDKLVGIPDSLTTQKIINDKQYYINHLELNDKVENGYLKGWFPFKKKLNAADLETCNDRSLCSFAYYLLPSENVGPWHKIDVSASWQLCDGDKFLLHMISKEGVYQRVLIGNDIKLSEEFVYIVPPGW